MENDIINTKISQNITDLLNTGISLEFNRQELFKKIKKGFFNKKIDSKKLLEYKYFLNNNYKPYIKNIINLIEDFYTKKEIYIRYYKIKNKNSNNDDLYFFKQYFEILNQIIPKLIKIINKINLEIDHNKNFNNNNNNNDEINLNNLQKTENEINNYILDIINDLKKITNIKTLKNNRTNNIKNDFLKKIRKKPLNLTKVLLSLSILFNIINISACANQLNTNNTNQQIISENINIAMREPLRVDTLILKGVLNREGINITENYKKNYVDSFSLDQIKEKMSNYGYNLENTINNCIVTAYNPEGPGLMANGYIPNGKTAIGRLAKINLDGIAVAFDKIPRKSIVYIEGLGFKYVDDTGGHMRKASKKGKYHIDIRTQSYKGAINFGKQIRKIYIFTPSHSNKT